MSKIEILLLLEIFLLRQELANRSFDYAQKCDFVIAVTDYAKKYDVYSDGVCKLVSMLRFLSLTDDKDFRYLCQKFTSYILKFYRRIDKNVN